MSYRMLFGSLLVRSAFLSVLLSAIPLGTVTLALVLSVQSWTGSLALAGFTAAVFSVGNAIGLAVQGVVVDRIGDRGVVAAGLVCGFTLGVVGGYGHDLPVRLLLALVGLAGLSVPGITTAVRRSLPLLIADPSTRSAGYAALSMAFQLAFAVGPLLVSLCLVVAGAAPAALLLSAAMIWTATALFATVRLPSPVPRSCQTGQIGRRRSWWRPLVSLLVVAALTACSTGLSTVAVPAVLQASGAAPVVGVAFAAGAVGDVIGAAVLGSRVWPLSDRAQLRFALLAAAAAAVAVFLASATPWLMVAAMGFGGAVGAPVGIRLSSLLDQMAQPGTLGVAYGSLVSIGLLSAAAGATVAGRLAETVPAPHLLLGAPALLLGAAAVSATLDSRHT